MTADASVAATYSATLIDEWVARGLRHAIVCPGSRSTPMAVALQADGRVEVQVHLDERSAAFMALGIGQATRRPAIVLTTSGTAAVELHPAVVEAHHADIPLLAVTADRPPELVGTGAPQTIDQRELFGTSARWYCEPGVPTAAGRDWWRDLAADCIDRTMGVPPGPVHLNVAFAEPLVGAPGTLPPGSTRPAPSTLDLAVRDEQMAALAPLIAMSRGVIIAGERSIVEAAEGDLIIAAAIDLEWPILADHLSGLRRADGIVVGHADQILRHRHIVEALRPDVVVRLGGLAASKVLGSWIDDCGAVVVGIDRWGHIPDPSRRVAHEVVASPSTALAQFADASRRQGRRPAGEWTRRWAQVNAATASALAQPGGEPGVAVAVVNGAPDGGCVVVSSSMPVRDVEWFAPARPHVTFHSNRGANGIDGVVSTAVGVALAGHRTVVLVGDVAFLHDSNALVGLAARGVDLAIVVVDNDGGGIFSFLPQAEAIEEDAFERLFGTPHGVDVATLCAAHGIAAVAASDAAEVAARLGEWSKGGGVSVTVVKSSRADNVALHALSDRVGRALEQFDWR